MNATVTPVTVFVDSLPRDLGAEPWSDQKGIDLTYFAWNVVRRLVDDDLRRGHRIHRKEREDLEKIAFDGQSWNLGRYIENCWTDRSALDSRRYAAAFLLGCLVRSMMARRRKLSEAIGKKVAECGYREYAHMIWRGLIPLVTQGEIHANGS